MSGVLKTETINYVVTGLIFSAVLTLFFDQASSEELSQDGNRSAGRDSYLDEVGNAAVHLSGVAIQSKATEEQGAEDGMIEWSGSVLESLSQSNERKLHQFLAEKNERVLQQILMDKQELLLEMVIDAPIELRGPEAITRQGVPVIPGDGKSSLGMLHSCISGKGTDAVDP